MDGHRLKELGSGDYWKDLMPVLILKSHSRAAWRSQCLLVVFYLNRQ
jgi:hypothetical protein